MIDELQTVPGRCHEVTSAAMPSTINRRRRSRARSPSSARVPSSQRGVHPHHFHYCADDHAVRRRRLVDGRGGGVSRNHAADSQSVWASSAHASAPWSRRIHVPPHHPASKRPPKTDETSVRLQGSSTSLTRAGAFVSITSARAPPPVGDGHSTVAGGVRRRRFSRWRRVSRGGTWL